MRRAAEEQEQQSYAVVNGVVQVPPVVPVDPGIMVGMFPVRVAEWLVFQLVVGRVKWVVFVGAYVVKLVVGPTVVSPVKRSAVVGVSMVNGVVGIYMVPEPDGVVYACAKWLVTVVTTIASALMKVTRASVGRRDMVVCPFA
jgi:hypothetical protein